MKNWLLWIECAGNKLPHPVLLFIGLCVVIVVLSALGAASGWNVTHPVSGENVLAQSLLSRAGIGWILSSAIENFVQFAPVRSALVAILGIGIAEKSGLLSCLLRAVVIATVGAPITARLERLYPITGTASLESLLPQEKSALRRVAVYALLAVVVFAWLFVADASPLQTPGVSLTQSSLFSHSIVMLISIFAALAGIVYDYSVRSFKRHEDVVIAAEESIGTMSGYIMLMFFAAQFVSSMGAAGAGIRTDADAGGHIAGADAGRVSHR